MMAWHTIVYLQGEEADEVFTMLYDIEGVVWHGPYDMTIDRTVEHLAKWDNGEESEHSPYTEEPWGGEDYTETCGEYTLTWNTHCAYISLNRRTDEQA
jgi:hypothetical protein